MQGLQNMQIMQNMHNIQSIFSSKYHAGPHVQGLLTKVHACLSVTNAYLGRK